MSGYSLPPGGHKQPSTQGETRATCQSCKELDMTEVS